MATYERSIDVDQLRINKSNPRFDPSKTETASIKKMIEEEGEKLYRLADHIIVNGLNPLELVAVTPDENGFLLLEGNRRAVALKLLNKSILIREISDEKLREKFERLENIFKKNPIKNLTCKVFETEEEAYPWITLKHTGENAGAGLVKWDSKQTARWESKVKGKLNVALQAIQLLDESKYVSDSIKSKLREVPTTNLERLLSDNDVREKLGLEKEKKTGKLKRIVSEKEAVKGLSTIIDLITTPKFTVSEIYTKDKRAEFINLIPSTKLPIIPTRTGTSTTIVNGVAGAMKKKLARGNAIVSRNSIVPKECPQPDIKKYPKISKLYKELQDINCKDSPHLAGVGFRVLVEISVDAFIESYAIMNIKSLDNAKLNKKINAACDHLIAQSIFVKRDLTSVRSLCTSVGSIFSVDTWHAWVHGKYASPNGTDLMANWDNIQHFIFKIYELLKTENGS